MVEFGLAGRTVERQRLVLIGASNLTRGISTAVETARQTWPGRPLEIFFALGHGRCYSMASSVLGRTLPSILECGLWSALDAPTASRPAALVTDIGNDLLFGRSVERTADAVARCLDRLLERGCRVTLTGLPVCNLERLTPWRFQLFKRLLFPTSRLTFAEAGERSLLLDERVQELAKQRNIPVISPKMAWYGFDPIHIKLRHWRAAWSEYCVPWQAAGTAPQRVRGSLMRWLYLRSLRPEQRRLLGIEQRAAQPTGRLPDGTTIALY